MNKLFVLLILASSCLAIQNFKVSLSSSSNGFAVVEQSTAGIGGGLADTNLVWVSKNSPSALETGTMASPYKNLTYSVVTQNYDKTIVLMPGVYVLETNYFVNGNVHIMGLSKNPNDVLLTTIGTSPIGMFYGIGSASMTKFLLENVTITATSYVAYTGSLLSRGLLGFSTGVADITGSNLLSVIRNSILNNCIIRDCWLQSPAIFIAGMTMNSCKFINNTCQTNSTGLQAMLRYSVINDCIISNNFSAKTHAQALNYIVGFSRIHKSIVDSCVASNTLTTANSTSYATSIANGAMYDSIIRNCSTYSYARSSYSAYVLQNIYSVGPSKNLLLQNNVQYTTNAKNSVALDYSYYKGIQKMCVINSSPVVVMPLQARLYLSGLRFADFSMTNVTVGGDPSKCAVYNIITNTGFCKSLEYL